MNGQEIDVTLERIALIRRLVVAWNGEGQGAPIIHPDAPYGSTAWDEDIANVTGDDEGAEEEHRAVGEALKAFVRHATLKAGRFTYHNPLEKLDLSEFEDVFRDGGRSPAQITFDVTPEHLALIPHLAVIWDEARAVPAVEAARPYGGGADLAEAMAGHLGIAAAGEEGRLDRLHHEMQPALQIFLRYADIAPGLYR
ncbi:hypothetical protein [Methylobacterium soli]|uniref:Uncharacterized protein n=1 Tax=Methylobacterium soli TaxID=553447 RepID=A0A6L3T2D5_9HYPH|nr:hypothetical protein [Methylobacterium soli]KAB1080057.1 hypothetical protein F6X53_07420 [Methylobacterium soli]GJE42321.1 hypothetical protein AEGHOMDF_1493 [Methylobacterium soli]